MPTTSHRESLTYTHNEPLLRLATEADVDCALAMVEGAQRRLRLAGIDQWQNGYPNRERLEEDVRLGWGRVLEVGGRAVAYGAVTYDGESAYDGLANGSWIDEPTEGTICAERGACHYATVHRLCVAEDAVGQGYGRVFMRAVEKEAVMIESIRSVRVDTHPDNAIMQHLLASLNYAYCGHVYYESLRLAYAKLLR